MLRLNSESLSLWPLYQKISSLEEVEVELVLGSTSPLLENLLALKILRSELKSRGREIRFLLADPNFEYLSPFLNEGESLPPPVTETQAKAPVELTSPAPSRFAFTFPSLSFLRGRRFFLVLFSVGLLFLISFLGLYFFPGAKVSLFLDSEPLTKPIEVSAETGRDSISEDPPAIPALEVEARLTKSESSPSGGRKEVGEKAGGTVTIYNKTTAVASFPAGTAVIKAQVAGDDLRFLTKAAVSVPARTADGTAVSGYQPGTATVEVTAEKLGDEYNISSGQTLNVSGKSTGEFIAQNSTEFSGGSRRQVTVVTGDDQKKLLEATINRLKEELKASVLAKVVSGQVIDEESISYEVVNKSFDRAVGDEADRLNLNLEIRAFALAFLEGDLKSLAGQLLADFVPDGYELFGEEREVSVTASRPVEGRLQVSALAKGFIVPKVDALTIKRKLVGQSTTAAKDYLASLKNVSSFSLERFPDFSFFPFLPFRPENLKVEITRK